MKKVLVLFLLATIAYSCSAQNTVMSYTTETSPSYSDYIYMIKSGLYDRKTTKLQWQQNLLDSLEVHLALIMDNASMAADSVWESITTEEIHSSGSSLILGTDSWDALEITPSSIFTLNHFLPRVSDQTYLGNSSRYWYELYTREWHLNDSMHIATTGEGDEKEFAFIDPKNDTTKISDMLDSTEYTFGNGMTEFEGEVKAGGEMTSPITYYNRDGGDGPAFQVGFIDEEILAFRTYVNNDIQMKFGTVWNVESDYGKQMYITGANWYVKDDSIESGMSYYADYSDSGIANFGDLWIPNAGWVNDQITASGGTLYDSLWESIDINNHINFGQISALTTPSKGDVYYDSDDDYLKLYNGVDYDTLNTSGGSGTSANSGEWTIPADSIQTVTVTDGGTDAGKWKIKNSTGSMLWEFSGSNTDPTNPYIQYLAALGVSTLYFDKDSILLKSPAIIFDGLTTDNTETYLVAIDPVTGIISQRAVSSISGSETSDTVEMGLVAPLLSDTVTIHTFSGLAFSTSVYTYSSYYNAGSDTLWVVEVNGLLSGTSPSLTPDMWWDTDPNSTGATHLWDTPPTQTSTTAFISNTSFTNRKIPPGARVFLSTPTVTTAPDYAEWALVVTKISGDY